MDVVPSPARCSLAALKCKPSIHHAVVSTSASGAGAPGDIVSASACNPGWLHLPEVQPSDGDNAVATAPLQLPPVTSCKTHGRVLIVAAHDCHETDILGAHRDTLQQNGNIRSSLRILISAASEQISRSKYSSNTSELFFLWRCTWRHLRALGRGSVTAVHQVSPHSERENTQQDSVISLHSYSSKSRNGTDKS